MKWIFAICILALATSACQVKPEAIRYGEDACHFCSMTIVDNGYASEYVTSKGRVYKFDAIECMHRSVKNLEGIELAIILVSDRADPGNWIPADSAVFVIDPNLPSPMGENLGAFKDSESARQFLEKHELRAFNWNNLTLKK